MSNSKIKLIRLEFDRIKKENGGFITPEKIVEYAKSPLSPLHSEFCWNDTDAAEKYRIIQAGNLIRRVYVYIPDNVRQNNIIKVREYVSLTNDRRVNGYRHITEVITDEELKARYIDDLQSELSSTRNKLKTVSLAADKYAERIIKILETEKQILRKDVKRKNA